MAGVADEARMYVFLLFLLCLRAWVLPGEENDVSKGWDYSPLEAGGGEQNRIFFFQSQRKIRRIRKNAWVLENLGHNSGSSIWRTWESIVRRETLLLKGWLVLLSIFRLQTWRSRNIERVFFVRFDSIIKCLTASGSLLAKINCQLA